MVFERDGRKLNIFSDTESVQIAKRGDLRVSGSATNFAAVLQQQLGQVGAVLP